MRIGGLSTTFMHHCLIFEKQAILESAKNGQFVIPDPPKLLANAPIAAGSVASMGGEEPATSI
eukprot:12918320-Prorocentrum_lima.AAC.1